MVHLSAQPASGSTFAGWGGACSGKGDCPVMMSGDANVTATFDGPPPPDECAGLAPGVPGTSKSYQQKPLSSGDEVCERGVADGSGNLALWSTQSFMGFKSDIVLLDAAGTVGAKASGVATQLTAQLAGFEGMDVFPQAGHGFNVIEYSADGSRLASSAGAAHFPILAEDPTGGIMIATDAPAVDAYDSSGKQRWHAQLARAPVALGVDRTGNALALFKASTLHAQWIDHSGHVGAEFDLGDGLAPAPSDSFEVYPRIGSGLFVLRLAGGHTTWLHQLDSLATAAAAAPGYLASRPDTRLHMAHGGKAYAMLPIPAQGDCTQRIEVLAPSGKSCGSAEFRLAPGSCTTNFIDIGYDGTVVQQLPSSMEDRACAGTECSCTWRWWSGFFR
jgi:hypothetical protein